MAELKDHIRAVCTDMALFLEEKNAAYGNSVAEPVRAFAKGVPTLTQIDVRIDDKLSRLIRGHEFVGDDTVKDLAGYLLLRMAVQRLEAERA